MQNINPPNKYYFKELTSISDKRKWQTWFRKAYDGDLKPDSLELYGSNVKFIVICENDKELGFARINDKSKFFTQSHNIPVWNITDAYIKPAYRNKLVLKELIKHVIDNHHVKAMYIEEARLTKYIKYYSDLGFTEFSSKPGATMVWGYLTGFGSDTKR